MEESKASDGRKHTTLKNRTETLTREMVERGIRLEEALHEFEKSFVSAALELSDHNQTKAAKILGLHRNTLQSKIRLHGLNNHRAK